MKKLLLLICVLLGLGTSGAWAAATTDPATSITSGHYYSIQLPTFPYSINATDFKTNYTCSYFQFVSSGNTNGYYIKSGDQYVYPKTTGANDKNGGETILSTQASSYEWLVESMVDGGITYFKFRPYSAAADKNYLTAWSANNGEYLVSWEYKANQSRWLLHDVSATTDMPTFAYLKQGYNDGYYINSSTSQIKTTKELFKFIPTENATGFYIKSGSKYLSAKKTSKANNGNDESRALELSESAYEWKIEPALYYDTNNYYFIRPYAAASTENYITSWSRSGVCNVVPYTMTFYAGNEERLLSYWITELPTLEELIKADLTFAEIKSMGYTGDDIAEYYKPTYLDQVGWPTTAAWTTFKAAVDGLDDGNVVNTTLATPYQTMCAAYVAPSAGKFYRITDKDGNILYGTGTNTQLAVAASVDDPKTSVFYTVAGTGTALRLISYLNGYYIQTTTESSNPVKVSSTPDVNYEYSFGHLASHPIGSLRLYNGTSYWYSYNSASIYSSTNQADNDTRAFYFTEVKSLPVTISALKYASFCAPVAVKIPSGVTAYVATSVSGEGDEKLIHLSPISGTIIPANTGVILYANVNAATTYDFDITTGGEGTSILSGTTAAISWAEGMYTLQRENIENSTNVGFYGNSTTNSVVPGFKAYYDNTGGTAKGFKFTFDNETIVRSLEELQLPTAKRDIFNLAGQRMNKLQRGVNIVNGKKIIVK